MKIFTAALLLGLVDWSLQSSYCEVGGELDGMPLGASKWQDMENHCYQSISDQVHRELNASLTYLAMGAHFSTDIHYRPGIATFFLESASEERTHAKGLIEYILLRGYSVNSAAIPPIIPTLRWESIEDALKTALFIEKSVRQNFIDIIGTCEGGNPDKPTIGNDYHASDKLTGVYLEEQHESLRKISGHLATLVKMKTQFGSFAEIMFDKTLMI